LQLRETQDFQPFIIAGRTDVEELPKTAQRRGPVPRQPAVHGRAVDAETLGGGARATQAFDECLEHRCLDHRCLPGHMVACGHAGDKSSAEGSQYDEGMEALRQQLIAARERRRLSVSQVASLVGVDRTTVYRWEEGSRKPDVDMLRRWGEAVGVDIIVAGEARDEMSPQDALIAKIRAMGDRLDARTIRLLEAQLSVLGDDGVKKVS
jgi:transcriptional regulator with XRE-family HTH domain